MPETICSPSDRRDDSEFLIEEVVSDSILVDDVVDVAHCLVIFNPPSVSYL